MELTQASPTLLILTSAGIAALVSGLIALAGQAIERRGRRRELLLTKAIDLAYQRTAFIKEFAEREGRPAEFHDNVVLAEVYYQWLAHLFEHGELPPEAPTVPSSSRAKRSTPAPSS